MCTTEEAPVFYLKLKNYPDDEGKWVDLFCEEDWGDIDTTDFSDDPIYGDKDTIEMTGRCRFGNDVDGYYEILEVYDVDENPVDMEIFCSTVDSLTSRYSG